MKISCRETQRMITPYLEDELSDRECSLFLNHVTSCSRCMHELETSFMIKCALSWMDTDRDVSMNMHELLAERLKKSERILRFHRLMTFLLWTMIVLMGMAILFIIMSLFFRELLPEIGEELLTIIENGYTNRFG